jgi:hypothetical protein
MTPHGTADIKKPFLSGISLDVIGRIFDKRTGVGFKPSTLTMTIYDVSATGNRAQDIVYFVSGDKTDVTVVSAIVNDQEGVDVLDFCDINGNLELSLTPEDTETSVPNILVHNPHKRVVLFTFTWGSPAKTGKFQATIGIVPDRATVAT